MKYTAFKQKVKSFPFFSSSILGVLSDDTVLLTRQLSTWKKKGLVRSLRRGLYVLGPQDREVEPSLFYLANQMFVPSYVSLESALAFYGFIPEFVAQTTSVTSRKTCTFQNDFGRFTFQHVASRGFGGFDSVRDQNGFATLVATPEKAVIDFLYLNLSKFTPSETRVFEASYRFQNAGKLKPTRLLNFAKRLESAKLLAVVRTFIQAVVK